MAGIRKDPPRDIVARIVAEEAARAKVSALDVVGFSRSLKVVRARRVAVKRIALETGCTSRGLARSWGMSESSAKKWLNRAPPSLYDANTRERLSWAHGTDRTREIVTGRDPATNADLAAWRRLAGGNR